MNFQDGDIVIFGKPNEHPLLSEIWKRKVSELGSYVRWHHARSTFLLTDEEMNEKMKNQEHDLYRKVI